MDCKCGCGTAVKPGRKFVDKEHQLTWMNDGGARQIGALQPLEAKALGGHTAGTVAAASGRLSVAGVLGARRSREIAQQWRERAQSRAK